ncbi:MAG: DUF4277 domain-containing protein [Firmicutes bacterium]|nr:DUF4277 domain-containing protein [Bacillota bacterium]
MPPSIRIKALVINILAGKTPLYNVERFFKFQDTENLLGQGVTHEDLNDDCLARALDMLFEANPKKVTSTIMLNALTIEDILLTRIHADTTSISVYGEYRHNRDGPRKTKLWNWKQSIGFSQSSGHSASLR